MRISTRRLATLLSALVLGALVGLPVAGPASADICLPLPGLPCLPDLPGTTPLTATTPTSITGTPQVDLTLTAAEPTWSDASATTTYQWLRGGSAISGATGQTYVVAADDVDEALTVAATGTVNLLQSATSTSDPVTGLIGAAPAASQAPRVTGTPRVGGGIRTTSGTWSGPSPTYGYQWYRSAAGRSSTRIDGATRTTYAPTVEDAGRTLAVLVTATVPGHQPGLAASKPIPISRLITTTKLTTKAAKVSASRHPVVRLSLKGKGGAPFGKVTIFDRRTTVMTVTVKPGDQGLLTVRLPRLSPGKHALLADYAGTVAFAGSVSDKLKLRVTRG